MTGARPLRLHPARHPLARCHRGHGSPPMQLRSNPPVPIQSPRSQFPEETRFRRAGRLYPAVHSGCGQVHQARHDPTASQSEGTKPTIVDQACEGSQADAEQLRYWSPSQPNQLRPVADSTGPVTLPTVARRPSLSDGAERVRLVHYRSGCTRPVPANWAVASEI